MHFLSATEGHVRMPLVFRLNRRNSVTLVTSVGKITRRHRIFHAISKHIEVWIAIPPRSVHTVTKCTSACPLYPCTFSPMNSSISVTYAAKLFPDPGYYKVIGGPTPAKNPSVARIVARLLLIDQIFEPICRPIPPSNISNARDVTNRSR